MHAEQHPILIQLKGARDYMVETRYDEQIATGEFHNQPHGDVGEKLQHASEQVQQSAQSWRDAIINRFNQSRGYVSAKSRVAADQIRTVPHYSRVAGRRVDQFVHERPWVSIGIMSAVGIFCGVFLARSMKSAGSILSGVDIEDYT
jgi:ElaB/YqjD/DUF883 family membrane-anchored ribosome-binding protein